MKHLATASLSALLAMMGPTAMGQTTPNEVANQYPLVERRPCTDNESGEPGFCFLFQAGDGYYMVFTQDDAPVFMRHVVPPNPYVEVWRAPQGVSL